MTEPTTLTVVTTQSGGARFGGDDVRRIIDKSLPIEELHRNLMTFLDVMRGILVVDQVRIGDLVLDEITFSVEIGANGEFKLLGTGLSAQASSSLTFTLRRETK